MKKRLRASDLRLTKEWNSGWVLSVKVHPESVPIAQRLANEGLEDLSVEVGKWGSRSLTQNDYFHLLVGKIAEVRNDDFETVKRELVLDYGTTYKDDNGCEVIVRLKRGIDPIKAGLKYPKWCDSEYEDEDIIDHYIVYQYTHLYTTTEMNQLISGTIREAQALGIETLTPQELEGLRNGRIR